MYLRDKRLRLYQASLEVTVTINRLSIYEQAMVVIIAGLIDH